MKANPDIGVIQIQGHTDDQGASDANQTLSSRRAKAVRSYLILNADTSISLHKVEFPLSVRYKLWEMYGIVPRVGLGMDFAVSVSAKADGPNVAPIASRFTADLVVNLGAAIPMDFGDIDVDFLYKHGFSSVLEKADISLLELLLLVGYTDWDSPKVTNQRKRLLNTKIDSCSVGDGKCEWHQSKCTTQAESAHEPHPIPIVSKVANRQTHRTN